MNLNWNVVIKSVTNVKMLKITLSSIKKNISDPVSDKGTKAKYSGDLNTGLVYICIVKSRPVGELSGF